MRHTRKFTGLKMTGYCWVLRKEHVGVHYWLLWKSRHCWCCKLQQSSWNTNSCTLQGPQIGRRMGWLAWLNASAFPQRTVCCYSSTSLSRTPGPTSLFLIDDFLGLLVGYSSPASIFRLLYNLELYFGLGNFLFLFLFLRISFVPLHQLRQRVAFRSSGLLFEFLIFYN